MGTKLSRKKILQAIPDSGGIMTIIAGRLGVAWHTAQRAIESYPETQQAYQDEQERILDLAESKLYDSIQRGESQDVKWYLSKKGKKRGYGEQIDVNQSGVTKVIVEYVDTNTVAEITSGADSDQSGTQEA